MPEPSGVASDHERPTDRQATTTDRLVAEDEGHGFENPENQVMLHRAIERHFARHLGGRSAG